MRGISDFKNTDRPTVIRAALEDLSVRFGDTDHLFNRLSLIVKEIDTTDVKNAIKDGIAEWQMFRVALEQLCAIGQASQFSRALTEHAARQIKAEKVLCRYGGRISLHRFAGWISARDGRT
jgi:hypothetical protein